MRVLLLILRSLMLNTERTELRGKVFDFLPDYQKNSVKSVSSVFQKKTLISFSFKRLGFVLILLGGAFFLSASQVEQTRAQEVEARLILGEIFDAQQVPLEGVTVLARAGENETALGETLSQPDGSFILHLEEGAFENLDLVFSRPHFEETTVALSDAEVARLQGNGTLILPELTLARRIGPVFWIVTLLFIAMLAIIASARLHNTLAALLGMSLIYAISYLGEPLTEKLFIFQFERSLDYIDWNVIFLIMGMMIVIAVVERTGIFQWLAFQSYKLSGGRIWLLLIILMFVTGIASAFLDNVTTMLLITPITIQISIALGTNPLALLMPEVFTSNVVGISTLVGTPTNILIGSYAKISFSDFLINLTPGVLLAMAGLIGYSLYIYRKDYRVASKISQKMIEKLAERGKITAPENLRKAGWIGAGMLLLFIFGEHIHLLPSVTSLIGATVLMLWIKPDIEEMIEAVDWTTLVFFMSLFIVVGAVQEVGLISLIAAWIGNLVSGNLTLATILLIWLGGLLSSIVANIPFTAAMLPVVGYLTATIPGAENKVLFYALSVGSAMGGNGSLIGASANMVTAGISERAGYPISYLYFLKKGFPALLLTLGLATLWFLLHF